MPSDDLLLIGDLHFGKGLSIGKSGLGTNLNSRIIDQLDILDWIANTAEERGITNIAFSGDIFEDAKPDYQLTHLLLQYFKNNQSITWFIVRGNHDFKRTGQHYVSPLDILASANLPNVLIYNDPATVEFDNFGITFYPFRDKNSFQVPTLKEGIDKIKDSLDFHHISIPSNKPKVLFGHLALEGSLYVGDEIDDATNELICPLATFQDYDYVWMGHIHRPQVRSHHPYMAHIGSLDISDFGETDHQKILVHIHPNQDTFFSEIPVPSRPLRKLSITVPVEFGITSTQYVLDQIQTMIEAKSIENAIVKLEIKLSDLETKSIDKKLVENYIKSLGAFHISQFTESKNVSIVVENPEEMDNQIQPKLAVKIISEKLKFDSEEEKQMFLTKSLEIMELTNNKKGKS